ADKQAFGVLDQFAFPGGDLGGVQRVLLRDLGYDLGPLERFHRDTRLNRRAVIPSWVSYVFSSV
ncbi:MAG: hypothetical protein ACI97B_004465, partial [Verrucomicrobiales bacterium]